MKKHESTFGLSNNIWLLVISVLAIFLISSLGRSWVKNLSEKQTSKPPENNASYPNRLVGLSPSLVETLFALGLGDKLIAVNRYTSYPDEAKNLPKICGMVDVDFEQLLILEPDYLIMLESQNSLLPKFQDLSLPSLSLTHDTVDGIIKSFSEVAQVCGNENKSALIVTEIESHINTIKKQVAGKAKPRVLVCIHHSTDISQPEQIIVCGSGGYHRDLIEIAGGVNAYQGPVAFPKLSRENLINLNPDIIIDLVNTKVAENRSQESLVKLWDAYAELAAVQNKRIVIADGAEHFLPGPRFLSTLDVFAEGIHGVRVNREGTILKAFEKGENH